MREADAVADVLRSGWAGLGPKTEEFEERFARLVGARYAVATNSCTSALEIALRLLGVGPGDEVIVPTITFLATAHAAVSCGAWPVFCDVRPDTLLLDWQDVERRRTARTKAIVPVLYAGQVERARGSTPRSSTTAPTRPARVLTPAASWPAGRSTRSRIWPAATAACSRPTAPASCSARRLRWHGIDKGTWRRARGKRYAWRYDCREVGLKAHMNDIASAIGLVQLEKLPAMQARRREIAAKYLERLEGLVETPGGAGLRLASVRHPHRSPRPAGRPSGPPRHRHGRPLSAHPSIPLLREAAAFAGGRAPVAPHLVAAHARLPGGRGRGASGQRHPGVFLMKKIAYFPLGGRTVASSRLRVWKIADALARQGHTVLFAPSDAKVQTCQAAVVQKRMDLGPRMQRWRAAGVKVVWDIDDYHPYQPPADVVTIGAERLRELYPQGVSIPDALDVKPDSPIKDKHGELRRVCWFGISENQYHAQHVYEACQELDLELTIIMEPGPRRFAQARYVRWSLETVDREITACDLAACSYVFDGKWPAQWVAAKGENRLFKAWALGMPVIGTPIQAYVDAGLEHLAATRAEWVEALEATPPARGARPRRCAAERLPQGAPRRRLPNYGLRRRALNFLNIGSAGKGAGGWKNLDADPANGPDIVARIPPLPDEVKQTLWDRVEMIHVIEHLHQWEAEQVLEQVYGVLRPGGLLILELPNIQYCWRGCCWVWRARRRGQPARSACGVSTATPKVKTP